MSMDRLHLAALAAGFAMAAPDDDAVPLPATEALRTAEAKAASGLPAIITRPRSFWDLRARRALSALGARVWQRLPSLTGRAAA